jgi:lipopolysaccharide export system protein LptA
MNGKVYNDGVDISTNKMFLDRIISYKADNIEKKDEQGIIKLTGNAEVKGEDVIIKSDQITLYLSQWKNSNYKIFCCSFNRMNINKCKLAAILPIPGKVH